MRLCTNLDPDAGKDWGQEEKRATGDEMVGWHHWLNGHEFEQTQGDSEGQGGLACCSSWSCKVSDTTERLNNNKSSARVCVSYLNHPGSIFMPVLISSGISKQNCLPFFDHSYSLCFVSLLPHYSLWNAFLAPSLFQYSFFILYRHYYFNPLVESSQISLTNGSYC